MSDSEDDMSVTDSEEGEDMDLEEDMVADEEVPVSDGEPVCLSKVNIVARPKLSRQAILKKINLKNSWVNKLEASAFDGDDHDLDACSEGSSDHKWFQKEIWQLKKLPYRYELERQANTTFGNIKSGLAHAILLNDPTYGLLHWILELEKYMDHYGRRFSKEDHILLVKLLLTTVKKGELYRDVKMSMHCATTLLKKPDFLLRGDIVIDWRPLYELYCEVCYKNLEEEGIFLLPDGFKTELQTLIFYSRSYFHDDVVQELLDEFRPLMCPFDDAMVKAWKMMDLFVPMNFNMEMQKTHGAGLWFDEAVHWYSVVENNSLIDVGIVKMFARLAYECPGYIDWTPCLDLLFTNFIRSLRLGILVGLCQSFSADTGALLITYLLGTQCHEKVIDHLRSVYTMVESYLHPSNNGSHTQHILSHLQRMTNSLVIRVKRERFEKPNKPKTCNKIPQWMKLSQEHLDEVIKLMLPCIKLAIFSKASHEYVTPMVKNACALCPKIVIPAILDLVYPALETVTEPHRLLQALQMLVTSAPIIAKDNVYRIHIITLLNSLLPGLDKNDISKCMVTFQFVGIAANIIPIADCSDAVHLRNDLNDEEKELCSSTANFETIITMFMEKLFSMLTDTGETANSAGIHGTINAKGKGNIEDNVLHRGTISVFKAFFRNSSSALYTVAMERVYSFLSENIFDSKVVCECVGDMVFVAVKYNPDVAFPKFYKLIMSRLKDVITPETFTEEKPDFQVTWWLAMATRLVKIPAHTIRNHWDKVRELLDIVVKFEKCNDATERSLSVFENILDGLCSIYVLDTCRRRVNLDKASDEYLPIRHWCEPVDKKTWDIEWHVPTAEDIEKAEEIYKDFFLPAIEELKNPQNFKPKEILMRLWRIRHIISGSGAVLPMFEGPVIPLNDCPTFLTSEHLVCLPENTPMISLNGRHIREIHLECLTNLLAYLLEHSEDDVKSINEIIIHLNGLENYRGVTKEVFQQASTNYHVTKLILSDRISGNKANIEMLTEDYTLLLHKKRMAYLCGYQFRQQNLHIMKMLIRLATSTYSQVRSKAQLCLLNIMKEHPYSYKLMLEHILPYLDPANNSTHEQIKGALYTLIEGKRMAIIMRSSFVYQLSIWSSIISTKHSEKPSIIKLMESAQNTLVEGYESYRVKFESSEELRQYALQLLEVKEACPTNPTVPSPSQEVIAANANNLQNLSEHMERSYYALAEKLLELSNSPSLHWKHVDMAQSMLSLLIRRDMAYPKEALKCVVNLLTHDAIKTRRMATAVLASWLRINKPKAVKQEIPIQYPENLGPGAKWPIKYGLRDDNRSMMYEEDKLPKTVDEWNNFQFCGKQHWGFYTWPKKLVSYAPLSQQVHINQQNRQFNESEQYILAFLRDPIAKQRLRILFSIEEKKGEEAFNAVNFSFFQGLVRYFNDEILDIFKDHLDILIVSEKDSDHRLASEMVASLVNGSKLWMYEKQQRMWSWLGPVLIRALETVKEESLRNWGVCLATICGSCDARLLKPVIDILITLISKNAESAFAASSRLFLMQGSLCQFEWRTLELWHKIMHVLKPYMIQQYANLRERIAVCLVSATWYDLPFIHVDPALPQELRPITVDSVFSLFAPSLSNCWDEYRLSVGENGDCESEVKKQSRLALKSVITLSYNQSLQSFIAMHPAIVKLIPLFCHYNNDIGDEELQKSCGSLLKDIVQAIFVSPDNAPNFINVFEQVLTSHCWWRTKVALLVIIRTMVFANLFVFKSHRETIGKLLIGSLSDQHLDVREASASAISTLLKVGFFNVTPELVATFTNFCCNKDDIVVRHGGVLGLCSIVLAYPYTVPDFLPDVLMRLCRFASDKTPVRDAVKKALSEFKRTHLDSWREHETQFNEDQLNVLRDLLISPNYYV